jgi:hypothetical protein
MKKIIIGFALLILTTIAGIWAFSLLQKPIDIFVSPSGKYKVELYGDKRRPWFFANTVTAKMLAHEKVLASEQIHYGDALDVSFESAYKFIDWENNNVLRFGFKEKVADNHADTLTIINNSSQKLKYLVAIFSRSKYLIFELNSASSQLLTENYSTHNNDIYIGGVFEDGEKIESKGANFPEQSEEEKTDLFKYYASVENNKVSITRVLKIQ